MKSIAIATSAINVPFHGNRLFVVSYNGEPYTPMKPIVEGMGMDWASQFTKLKHRFTKGIVEITIPSPGGAQTMICLALRKLAGWLQTISPNKVKPEIRERVVRYQEECDDVLYEYWTTGQVTRKAGRPASKATVDHTPLSAFDADLFVRIRKGKTVHVQQARPGEHFISFENFKHIAEKAGYLVIHCSDLRDMTMDAILAIGEKRSSALSYRLVSSPS